MQSKEDLRELFSELIRVKLAQKTYTERLSDYRLVQTSGTAGIPLPVVYTSRPDWNPLYLSEGERVLMLSGSKCLRLDFMKSQQEKGVACADVMFLNQAASEADVSLAADEFRPTSIVSASTTLLRLTKGWSNEQCNLIEQIVLAAELSSESVLAEISKRFSKAEIINMFASMEAGLVGVSCSSCVWNEFHPHEGVEFNIDNPDEAGVGDLLVTKQNLGGVLLNSYKIGDVAELSEHDNKQTIKLYGRRGFDYIKLSNALLIREEFDRVANELSEYIYDYKVEVSQVIKNGLALHTLTIYIVLPKGLKCSKSELVAQVATEFPKRLFVTPNSTLAKAIEAGVFLPLVVKVEEEIMHATLKPQRLYRVG